jgi:hypothetical protein
LLYLPLLAIITHSNASRYDTRAGVEFATAPPQPARAQREHIA